MENQAPFTSDHFSISSAPNFAKFAGGFPVAISGRPFVPVLTGKVTPAAIKVIRVFVTLLCSPKDQNS